MKNATERWPSIATLAMAAAISPLAMNVYLPSLPSIADHFQTSAATAQLSVSLFLAATAAMQLIFGPMSDKYGRRPIMLILLCVMLMATLVCIYAINIEMFLVGRFLQASAAVGIVLSRAIVRDRYQGSEAASKIAYVTMGMTLAPMIGPALGGLLQDSFGWQASFWLVFCFTAIAVTVIWFDLNETNRFKGGTFFNQFRSFPEIIKSRRFWGYSATCAFSSGAFFAFLGGGPLLAIEYYGLKPTAFGFHFIFIAVGYLIGNFMAGRLSVYFGLNRMMMIGNLVVLFGLTLALVLTANFRDNAFAFFALIFFVGLGNGITLPNANAGIVAVRPKIAGAASGLGATLQIGGGAIIAAITGYYISFSEGPQYLLSVMIFTIICAIASTLYVLHIDKVRKLESTRD
ncbi:MAG: multidrug effflux MFS transporter [Pseudomonadota bacterium]